MIYDSFMLGDATELDMLECRLTELDGTGVIHILVEGDHDHQGHPKPWHFLEHSQRFDPWIDRIVYVQAKVPGPDDSMDPWIRERTQREHVRVGLINCAARADDILLLCDVDEIPSRSVITRLENLPDELPCMVTLKMRMAMFAVDWVLPEQQEIAVAGYIKDCMSFPFGALRENGYRKANPQLEDAGWHLSWLGGPAEIHRKAQRFCHTELRDMILHGNRYGMWYQQGLTWYGTDWTHRGLPPGECIHPMLPATVDETWPKWIYEGHCLASWYRPDS